MPSISDGLRPASAIALRTASQAIESVVRLEGRRCGVSPTPTMQYLSVNAPIDTSLNGMIFADYCRARNTALQAAANSRSKSFSKSSSRLWEDRVPQIAMMHAGEVRLVVDCSGAQREDARLVRVKALPFRSSSPRLAGADEIYPIAHHRLCQRTLRRGRNGFC